VLSAISDEAGGAMKDWTPSEHERRAAVQAGMSVVANMRKGADDALVAWAKEQGLLVYIGRRTRDGRNRPCTKHRRRERH
jgi:hypothetical protein